MKLALPERFRAETEARLPAEVEVAWYADAEAAPAAVRGADVLWLNMWERAQIQAALAAGDELRWVSMHGAGVDGLPLDLLRGRRLTLTNGAGLHAMPISEYAVLGMLALAKGFPALVRAQDRKQWLDSPPAFGELHGTKALIVGYGGIGRAIGERLRAFGVEVVGARRHPVAAGEIAAEAWRDRLGEFDWVILASPLTNSTRAQVGAAELGAMKPTAVLVNIARGGLVDEAALAGALRDGRLAGAYLDVTSEEPLPSGSDLWTLPNLILTPHSSWASQRFAARAADLFLDNLDRFGAGRPLRNIVDLDAGY